MTAKHVLLVKLSCMTLCQVKLAMEPAALYRDNSSVTPGLHPNRLPGNFYSNRGHGGVGGPSSFGFEHGGGPQASAPDPVLSTKVDQMMNMLSSTQQLLLAQQDTCSRLEDTVTKLSCDVAAIQQELASGPHPTTNSGSKSSRRKVPRELSVSITEDMAYHDKSLSNHAFCCTGSCEESS